MMDIGAEHSGSGSSDDVRQMVSVRSGGGDEGSHTDQHRQLEWDPYTDAGYDGNSDTPDFRWNLERLAGNVLLPNVPECSRFVGTFSNENEDEFYSLTSTEYLSLDDDSSPRSKSENQQIQLTFPKMALKLNLDVTVSELDPATGKLELTCSTGDRADTLDGIDRKGNIANCEMWLNGQYLLSQASRSSSSDIDLISQELFPEFDNFSSENLKSSSDSKLSNATDITNTNDGFNADTLKTRLDNVRKHYRLFNFSDEEESIYFNKRIEESANNLDRLIAWYNEGCKSDLSSSGLDISQEGKSQPQLIHTNKTPVERNAKSSPFVPEAFVAASAKDIFDLADMPHLPSLPSSPLPSRESLEESRDSLSDTATTCDSNDIQLKNTRASWLTIYKSTSQLDPENRQSKRGFIHLPGDTSAFSDTTPSRQNNQLFFARETTEAEEITQRMVDDSLSDSDEGAGKSPCFGSNSETNHCVETTTNSVYNHSPAQIQEIGNVKEVSSTLFDSAFGSMLQEVSEDAESHTNISPSSDRRAFAELLAGHSDGKLRHKNDSQVSISETGNFQLRHELNIPSGENLASYPSLSNFSYSSHFSDDFEKTSREDSPSTLLRRIVSKESTSEESQYEPSFVKELCVDDSRAGGLTLSEIFNEKVGQDDCLSYQCDSSNSGENSLFVSSSEETDNLSPKLDKGQSRGFPAESDVKSNEEKLRVLAMSYGLLDDAEVGYESYDSEDSDMSVVEREENVSPSRSDRKLEDDAGSGVMSAVDVDAFARKPAGKETRRSPYGNDVPHRIYDDHKSGQTRSSITPFSTTDLPGAASSSNTSRQESNMSAKSSSTYDVLDSPLWENLTMKGPADEIEKKLNKHKQSRNFQSEDSLFSFSDDDQINFLGKFQNYIESLDIGLYDRARHNQHTSTSAQEVDDDGYFSSFCENKAKACNMQKFLGTPISPSKSDASDMNSVTDCGNLLDNIARKMATKIVSDFSLSQRESSESVQSLSDATVENARSSDTFDVYSSDESLGIDQEKHSLSPQNSDQNVRSISSKVFSCPYFDDIWRLDLVTSSAEDIGRWPVSTFSVSDLASRSHSQVMDLLNSAKNVELLEYSLDVYKEDDDDNEEFINAKSALESTELLAWVSERSKTTPNESASQQSPVSDTISQQSNVSEPTTEEGKDCDHKTESTDVCEKAENRVCESKSKPHESTIDITRIPSDRYSYSAKVGTFLQHNDYDSGKRDSSKGPVIAAIEHEALAQYANLLVKTVISDAHKKFVWNIEGCQENENKSEESPSFGSETLVSVSKKISSESQQSNLDETHRTETKDAESYSRLVQYHRDKNSNVLLKSNMDETQGISSLDYCQTLIAAGLSSVAIRQGMNELRLVACKEWHSTRPETKKSSSETSTSEAEPEVDKYTRYKSKLRELKMQRQRGGGRRNQNLEQKTSVAVDKKSKFVPHQSESSSDETSDDSSDDDEDMDEHEKDSFAALRRRIEETTIAEIEKLLDNMRMMLIARQAQHSRRLERYRRKAESSLPSPLCPDHNGYLPPSTRENDQPNNCWCSIEKAEAVRKLACEVFRGRDLENTKLCILKIEDEHKAMRDRINAGQNLVFNTKSLRTPQSTNLEVQTKRVLKTEGEALKASLSKYLGDFENALTQHYMHGFEDSGEVKNDTQNDKEFESILSKDMDDFTKDLNRVFDGIQDEVKKDYEDSENQKRTQYEFRKDCENNENQTQTTEQSVETSLEDIGHQEGIQLPVKKDVTASEHSEKECQDSVLSEDSTRLERITAQAFRLDSSRDFLADEYKQLKDNRLGVDLNFLVPEKVTPNEGELSPLVTPKCSICKLRKKVNKVDHSEASENMQTADNYEMKIGSSATIKRFGGHEYDVVTGGGIRKHKVSCALCKTRKDVGV